MTEASTKTGKAIYIGATTAHQDGEKVSLLGIDNLVTQITSAHPTGDLTSMPPPHYD